MANSTDRPDSDYQFTKPSEEFVAKPGGATKQEEANLGTYEYQFFVDSPANHDYQYMSPLANSETSIGGGVALNRQGVANHSFFGTSTDSAVLGKVGNTDKQLTDADGAIVSYPLWQILPESVNYANGTQVEFSYSRDGDIQKITEIPGLNWFCDPSLPANPDGFRRWTCSDGRVLNLDVLVLPNGNYQMTFETGDVYTYTTSGKRLWSRPFRQNFELQQSLIRVFNKLDRDGSGILNKGDINQGVTREWNNPDDAQLITMLKLHYELIQLLREKSIFKIGKGLSKDDINQYDQLMRKVFSKDSSPESVKTITALFDYIDTDHDQNISFDEIKAKLADGKLEAVKLTSINYIINHSQKLHAFTAKGYVDRTLRMTKSEFIQHYNDVYNEQVTKYLAKGGWGIEKTWRQTMDAKRTLFANPKLPYESLRVEAIKQGIVGDCLFLAALASIISVRPGAIMQSIIPNENGTFTVTFLGAPEAPIVVKAPTSSELALYARASEYGYWAPLLEKAYGLLVAKRRNLSSIIPAENTATRENMKALEILGGRKTEWEYTQDSASRALGICKQSVSERAMKNLLINCFTQGRAMTAAALKGAAKEGAEPAICGMHAYSIIDYDDKNNIVTMRNPWGIVSKQGNQTELYQLSPGKQLIDDGSEGIFRLPLSSFCKKFEGVCVESK